MDQGSNLIQYIINYFEHEWLNFKIINNKLVIGNNGELEIKLGVGYILILIACFVKGIVTITHTILPAP